MNSPFAPAATVLNSGGVDMLGQDPKQAELAAFLAPNINLSDAESSRIRELMKKVNDAVVEFAKASSEENERCLSNIPLHETEQDRWLELSDSLAATTRRAEAAEAEVSLLRAQLSAFESASTGALAPPPQQSPPLQSSPPSPSASVPPSSSLATTAGAGSPECAPDPSGVFGDCGETGLTAAEEAELSGLLSRKGGLITAVDRERVRELMTRAEAVATQQKELKELEDLMASANDKARGGLSLQQIERVKVLMQGEVERARGGGVPGPPSAGGASAAAAAAASSASSRASSTATTLSNTAFSRLYSSRLTVVSRDDKNARVLPLPVGARKARSRHSSSRRTLSLMKVFPLLSTSSPDSTTTLVSARRRLDWHGVAKRYPRSVSRSASHGAAPNLYQSAGGASAPAAAPPAKASISVFKAAACM
mmetsp:Transcript_67880/g.127185  ORF Transcript_67880/g.127185 Transcript_67880/m.127185 type:complete len:424 (-) Transcript_67880:275-1546(-)